MLLPLNHWPIFSPTSQIQWRGTTPPPPGTTKPQLLKRGRRRVECDTESSPRCFPLFHWISKVGVSAQTKPGLYPSGISCQIERPTSSLFSAGCHERPWLPVPIILFFVDLFRMTWLKPESRSLPCRKVSHNGVNLFKDSHGMPEGGTFLQEASPGPG